MGYKPKDKAHQNLQNIRQQTAKSLSKGLAVCFTFLFIY